MTTSKSPVVVIVGAGGIGTAIAQRIGSDKLILLADYSQDILDSACKTLQEQVHRPQTHTVDIGDFASVQNLAEHAASLGNIHTVVHTAGVAPATSTSAQIYTINLIGTIHVIDAFQPVMTPGSSLLCIASMAGHLAPLPPADEEHLATAPVASVLDCPSINPTTDIPGNAYGLSKRANILRVRAAANAYGQRGARINSVSPGIISTARGNEELASEYGAFIQQTADACAAHRVGTPEDVAEAAAFLVGERASYITGTDLLVDGGASILMREAVKARMQQGGS